MQSVYLRLSVTRRCDLRCRYCQPEAAAPRQGEVAPPTLEEVLDMVALLQEHAALRKVRITGGEPLILPWTPRLVRALRRRLPGVTLALTTNGTRLLEVAADLRRSGLDRLNVSLDAASEEGFERVTGRTGLGRVLDGIRAAHDAGFRGTKLNCVMLRGVNDDQLLALCRLAASLHAEVRFIELMPMGAGAPLHRHHFMSSAEALARLTGPLRHMRHLGRRGAADRHLMQSGDDLITVGFISPLSNPFCASCDRVRLDPTGKLLGCLRSNEGVDLLGAVRGPGGPGARERLGQQVRDLLRAKGAAAGPWPRRSMVSIGG